MMAPSYEIVVLGMSSGGLSALGTLLASLPPDFRLPLVAVQHRAKESDETLAAVLQLRASLSVCEAEDKQPLEPGHIYLGPADYHLLVEEGSLALSTEEPVAFSRPSIDVLFESAADSYGPKVIAVLLTGANFDGTRGVERIKRAGGYVILQDPSTAESPTMPAHANENVAVDRVVPLEEVAATLIALVNESIVTAAIPVTNLLRSSTPLPRRTPYGMVETSYSSRLPEGASNFGTADGRRSESEPPLSGHDLAGLEAADRKHST